MSSQSLRDLPLKRRVLRVPGPKVFAAGAAILLTGLTAGCGGSSSGSNSEIRSVDLIPDSTTATLVINGGSLTGSQSFDTASSYVQQIAGSDILSFGLSAHSATTYSLTSVSLGSNYYSAMLFGLASVTSTSDSRYPKMVLVTDESTAPTSGDARVRFVHAAPDASAADVLVNGVAEQSDEAYTTVGDYQTIEAGTIAVLYNKTGTSTAITASQSLTISSGHHYTVFLVETTSGSSPVYAVQMIDDTH